MQKDLGQSNNQFDTMSDFPALNFGIALALFKMSLCASREIPS